MRKRKSSTLHSNKKRENKLCIANKTYNIDRERFGGYSIEDRLHSVEFFVKNSLLPARISRLYGTRSCEVEYLDRYHEDCKLWITNGRCNSNRPEPHRRSRCFFSSIGILRTDAMSAREKIVSIATCVLGAILNNEFRDLFFVDYHIGVDLPHFTNWDIPTVNSEKQIEHIYHILYIYILC